MNHALKVSVANPSNRRRLSVSMAFSVAALGFVVLLGKSQPADAASFRCPHNASASERLVCNDPTLSALDDKLAALYRAALDATPNAEALEADRVSQWQWRQHNCRDNACVTDWYNRRIAELEGDLAQGNTAAVQRVKDGVVNQHLVPSAQQAVLRMKGIGASADGRASDEANGATGAPAPVTTSSPLHLHKMPSGVAADARQKRLAAQAQAHGETLAHGADAPVAASAVGTASAEAARTDDALNQPGAATVK
jgi:uncharacterized protein